MEKFKLFHTSSKKITEFSNDFIGTGDDNNSSLGIFATDEASYIISHYEIALLLRPESKPYIYEIEVLVKLSEELSKDEYYGNEYDETDSKEHFEMLREDFLEEGVGLVIHDFDCAMLYAILDASYITIKRELTLEEFKLENL